MRGPRFGFGVLGLTTALFGAGARPAAACGGCFTPPPPPNQTASDITDERMLLAVSPAQTTLYDQNQYSGSPSSFAWVLPIHGTVTIGLSADVLFDSIDALTETTIEPPPSSCPPPPSCGGAIGCASSNSAPAVAGNFASQGSAPPVAVIKQQNVGPYATVQLHSTDSGALVAWLTGNGYEIPTQVQPVLDAYVAEGFDFLAMKLLPDEGIQAMRPVRVTSPGAAFSLPLRMAAIGTGATVGITIWVVSDGRYEPQNFPFFTITSGELVWDWAQNVSNYTTLRGAIEADAGNRSWEIESSFDLSEITIQNAIVTGGQIGSLGSAATPSNPAEDYLPVLGDSDAAPTSTGLGAAAGAGVYAGPSPAPTDGGPGEAEDTGADAGVSATEWDASSADASPSVLETAAQVRDDDLAALFAGLSGPNVRVTRIRSDIAHAAMTVDLVLQASADQSELSNVRQASQSVNETCPIYDGCSVVGTGTPAQSAASLNKGGCDATARSLAGAPTESGVLAGLMGLGAARALRARSRRRQPR